MSKLYSAKEVLKTLNKAEFKKVSQKGSHIKLRGIREGKLVTVIVSNHKTIARGTFGSILRQAGKSSGSLTKLYHNISVVVLCHPRACPPLEGRRGSRLLIPFKCIFSLDSLLRGNDNLCQEE